MSQPTLSDLREAARAAIERRESFVYDCAADRGQMVENVAHMRSFERGVMQYMIGEFEKYAHLAAEAGVTKPSVPRG